MKQKIKAKTHGITRVGLSSWLAPEKQAINEIARNFQFRENFNLPEQVLRASHSIKYISVMMHSSPNVEQTTEYIQEMILTLNHFIILFSLGKMGESIKDALTPHLEIEFYDLTDILHGVNEALFKTLKNIDTPQNKEEEQNSESDLLTKAQLKKMALEHLCLVFLMGSSLHPTLTTDIDSNKTKGELYEFIIKIKPFFEMQSGIELGSDSSIGRDLFDARKKAVKNCKKSK
jgi:hypothetical protein